MSLVISIIEASYPKKFFFLLQPMVDEDALSHPLDDEVLDIMFIFPSSSTHRVIHTVIGEDFFSTNSRHVLYPSNLVSIFLSNAMDLLQSTSRLEIIAFKVVRPVFWAQNKLKQAMQSYDLWARNALVGGLFSRTMLMQKHEVLVTFKALQKSCEKHNSQLLTKTLQVMEKALGF